VSPDGSNPAHRARLYRLVFGVTAAYNAAFGLWAGFWPHSFFDLFQIPPPNYPAIWSCLGMVVGLYGLLYAWVAWRLGHGLAGDPSSPDRIGDAACRTIIGVGLMGKILGPIGWMVTVQSGEWPARTFPLIVFNDLIWWLPVGFFLLEGTTIGRRLRAAVPLACALANAAAAVAMLILLKDGTEAVPDMTRRIEYVTQNPVAWRGGWLTWNAAALSLLAFFAWWGERVPRPAWAIGGFVIGSIGVCFDLACEALYIGWLPRDFDVIAPAGSWTMGVVANGLYSLAGAVLTLATPRLTGWFRAWGWAVWAAGFALAIVVFLGSVIGTVIATAVMMALFCPWVALAGWKLK
jgi:hypothetical protein